MIDFGIITIIGPLISGLFGIIGGYIAASYKIGFNAEKIKGVEIDLQHTKEQIVWKDTCNQCQQKQTDRIISVTQQLNRLEEKVDNLPFKTIEALRIFVKTARNGDSS
jgi:hypothetical protein